MTTPRVETSPTMRAMRAAVREWIVRHRVAGRRAADRLHAATRAVGRTECDAVAAWVCRGWLGTLPPTAMSLCAIMAAVGYVPPEPGDPSPLGALLHDAMVIVREWRAHVAAGAPVRCERYDTDTDRIRAAMAHDLVRSRAVAAMDSGRWYTAAEIAAEIAAPVKMTGRALTALARSGLARKRRGKRKIGYYMREE